MTDKARQLLKYLQSELQSAIDAREKAVSKEAQYSYEGEIRALERSISFAKLLLKPISTEKVSV